MEFENNSSNFQNCNPDPAPSATPGNVGSPTPAPTIQYVALPPEKPKKTSGWRIFLNILLALSIIGNVLLFLAVIGMSFAMVLGTGGSIKDQYVENVLVDGSSNSKIAVINLCGVIEGNIGDQIRIQTENAAEDSAVKAVILRIDSPGGTVSASDQIHHYINKLRSETGKPVVAFMQSLAASGGYYSAVACDKIIAEPTVITGSIGVIMNHIVIKDLLEQKLGVQSEVLKSGEKKDWPSMFSQMTDEQKAYLNSKLIGPAYERFLKLVSEGRKNSLTPEQARTLADGSIYNADEALQNGLIDDIGYFDDVVTATEELAGISNAKVVEYERPLSWLSALGAQSKLPILNTNALEKLTTPQLLYLWDGR
jgi:protease-4